MTENILLVINLIGGALFAGLGAACIGIALACRK